MISVLDRKDKSMRFLPPEEFRVTWAEVTGCLSSRPLPYVSNSVDDCAALIPNHFLVQRPNKIIPHGHLTSHNTHKPQASRGDWICGEVCRFRINKLRNVNSLESSSSESAPEKLVRQGTLSPMCSKLFCHGLDSPLMSLPISKDIFHGKCILGGWENDLQSCNIPNI
ncbi:hypothetical protein TCAL_17058 [Tigriopus californicus]|uniref:Uncharacterized protein n=1 Tax=Tigriopus californicus TaxID=6832 RepID=A0A553PQ36_TIGCA|nr:hypothetical protein TCAL_17058 [Tigriopus californicus]